MTTDVSFYQVLENAIRSRLTRGGGDQWFRDEVLAAARPLIDTQALSAFEEAVALGYRPLPGED